MDSGAQKAIFPASGENVGHFSRWILYHFHDRKSLHSSPFRHDEELRVPVQKNEADISRRQELMKVESCGDVLLNGRPEIRNEGGRDAMNHRNAHNPKGCDPRSISRDEHRGELHECHYSKQSECDAHRYCPLRASVRHVLGPLLARHFDPFATGTVQNPLHFAPRALVIHE